VETRQQDLQEITETGRTRLRKRGLKLGALALLLVLIALFVWQFFASRRLYTQVRAEKSFPVSASANAVFAAFGNSFIRCSTDGVSCLSGEGREYWNESIHMNDPRLVIHESYGAVYDPGERTVLVFREKGVVGRYETAYPLIKLAISAQGVTAAALENGNSSLIQLYEASGRRLDIEINLELTLSGFPMAMALSPDGNGLVVSLANANAGHLSSQLVFYNFSVGKNESNRLVGFRQYDGLLLPHVSYLGAKRVIAVTDTGAEVISLEQVNKPAPLESISLEGTISAYAAGDGHVAILCLEQKSGQQMLYVYDANGRLCFSDAVSGNCLRLLLGEGHVTVVTDQGAELWKYNGTARFKGSVPGGGQSLFFKNGRLLRFDGTQLLQYRLQ